MMNTSLNTTPAAPNPLDCSQFDPATYVYDPYLVTSAFMMGGSMIILNLLVMIVMGWSMHKAKGQNIPKLLVLFLAIFDCSNGVFSVTPQAFRYWLGYCGIGGATSCVAMGLMFNIIMVMSSLFVVLMSAERFCALRMPFRYNLIFTMANTMKIMAGLFAYSVLVALLPLMGINSYAFGRFGCDFNWLDTSVGGLFYNYFRGFQGLILMPIIFGLNIAVLRAINKMTRTVAVVPSGGASGDMSGGAEAASAALQKRFAILTLCASAAFVICNTPILVRLIQYQEGISNAIVPDYVIKRMFISNSIINPCLSLYFYLSNIKCWEMFSCIKTRSNPEGQHDASRVTVQLSS